MDFDVFVHFVCIIFSNCLTPHLAHYIFQSGDRSALLPSRRCVSSDGVNTRVGVFLQRRPGFHYRKEQRERSKLYIFPSFEAR